MTRRAMAVGVLFAAQTAACDARHAPSPTPPLPAPDARALGRDAAIPASVDDYFPPERFQPPDLRAFMTAWYGQALQGLGEPSLWQRSTAAPRAMRLLYLRSFAPPESVRLERDGQDVRLVATRTRGGVDLEHGGFDPGPLELRRELSLSPAAWDRIDGLLTAASFATMPLDGERGLDGSDWIVESADRGEYRLVVRWSPRPDGPDAAYRRACEALLALAGADFAVTAR